MDFEKLSGDQRQKTLKLLRAIFKKKMAAAGLQMGEEMTVKLSTQLEKSASFGASLRKLKPAAVGAALT